jgi:hypothetical protein
MPAAKGVRRALDRAVDHVAKPGYAVSYIAADVVLTVVLFAISRRLRR